MILLDIWCGVFNDFSQFLNHNGLRFLDCPKWTKNGQLFLSKKSRKWTKKNLHNLTIIFILFNDTNKGKKYKS